MNKTLKILLIGLLLITLYSTFYFVKATAPDETSLESELENDVIEETPSTGISTLTSPNGVTNVSPVNSYSEANLELNNILCILLIAVGVVIILLSIAILIKIKK